MRFSRKEQAIIGVCTVMALGVGVAIAIRSWEPAVACLVVLQIVTVWLGLTILRRRPVSHSSALDRIEQRLDELSLRIVTESQATSRELTGLTEQLRAADEPLQRP
jgi:uncharacterized membrane protein